MNYVNYCSLNVAAIVLIHRSSLLGYGKIKTCNRVRRTGLPLGRLLKWDCPKVASCLAYVARSLRASTSAVIWALMAAVPSPGAASLPDSSKMALPASRAPCLSHRCRMTGMVSSWSVASLASVRDSSPCSSPSSSASCLRSLSIVTRVRLPAAARRCSPLALHLSQCLRLRCLCLSVGMSHCLLPPRPSRLPPRSLRSCGSTRRPWGHSHTS